MTTNTDSPGVLEEQIKTLMRRLTRAEEQVEAAEGDLANARDMRDDLRSELLRAVNAFVARGSEEHMEQA